MLSGEPPEDFGSETLARYGYQFGLAARECIRMLLGDGVEYIQVEWWGDFVVGRSTGDELVSVKHREPDQGAWTRPTLIDAGGLKKLCSDWVRAGEEHNTRLLTNGGLSKTKSNGRCSAAEIRDAAHLGGELRKQVSSDIAAALGVDAETAERFLQHLTIEDALPKRDELASSLVIGMLFPNCAVLGWTESECPRRFEVIRTLVFEVAQHDLMAQKRDPSASIHEDPVERTQNLRRITRGQVQSRLDEVHNSTSSRLQRKLEAGGLLPTAVENCKRLRQKWASFERTWDIGLPGPESKPEEVRDLVLGLAAMAETTAQGGVQDDEHYGAKMHDELRRLVERCEDLPTGVSVNLAMGAAFEESDRCRIYWSADREPATSAGGQQ